MDNGDATQGHAMTSAEFAKLMGAYPQPAENPLPAYGGYMDNSAANFSWVQNNDYFGAETKMEDGVYKTTCDCGTVLTWDAGMFNKDKDGNRVKSEPLEVERLDFPSPQFDHFEEELSIKCPTCGEYHTCEIEAPVYHDRLEVNFGAETFEADARELYRTDPDVLLELARREGLECMYCEGSSFHNPVATSYSKATGGATIYYPCDCGETQVVITGKTWGAENFNGLSAEEYYAEMEELTDGVASITNRFGDGVGIIQVDDEDLEDVSVEITDGDGDVVYEGILGDEDVPEMEDDDFYLSENKKKSSILPMALGVVGAIFAYQPVMEFLSSKSKKEEKMAETPELIENPNTGNLDPAQYEELVVESTGYAVDVIPQGLDGSFMGSRFAALPTERYVDYNEPGIGAHTDIALDRNEMYLEPEMAMVQASESVKESQAPGQSPYNSTTGEENRDFDMRVIKETQVVSLDPAVKPFIPQSMSGYTGNANTPPSVYDKMFNIGVLGQTPAFVPTGGDIGSSRTGSRNATPNTLGLGGSVGGPLSDQVNSNYTDGTTSMSLAQWSIENTVSQTSDTEAVVIDRSSGQMKRVRRV